MHYLKRGILIGKETKSLNIIISEIWIHSNCFSLESGRKDREPALLPSEKLILREAP